MQGPVKDSDGFEAVSPKRHVSQRRRTAEAQAEADFRKSTVFAIPKSPNSFGPLEENESTGADYTAHRESPSEPADTEGNKGSTLESKSTVPDSCEATPREEDMFEEEERAESSHGKR